MSIDPLNPKDGYTAEEREIVEQCKFDEYIATKDYDEDDDCDESESEEE
jgi:hypothetical protein